MGKSRPLLLTISALFFSALVVTFPLNARNDNAITCGDATLGPSVVLATFLICTMFAGLFAASWKFERKMFNQLYGWLTFCTLLLIMGLWIFNSLYWLNSAHWEKIKICLIKGEVCKSPISIRDWSDMTEEGRAMSITPVKMGCCNPPMYCGYQNRTWTSRPIKYNTSACSKWSEEGDKLCFNCQTCKYGYLDHQSRTFGRLLLISTFGIFLHIAVMHLKNPHNERLRASDQNEREEETDQKKYNNHDKPQNIV